MAGTVTDIHPKVAGSAVGSAGASVLIWVLGQFGVVMPLDIATSVIVVGGFIAGYLIPSKT